MKILYVAEDISLPGFHGGSTHVQETINALKELGHNVFVVCKKENGRKNNEKIEKVQYLRVKVPENGIMKNWFLFRNLGEICKNIIETEKIELVWQRNRIFGNQAIVEGKNAGIKTLLEMNEPIETSEENIIFPAIKRWFFYTTKFADKITGTHKCMFNKIPKEKQLLIHYGSNPKIFNPKRIDKRISKKYNLNGKTIFYSGSFQKWHCLKNALLAFKEIKKEIPKAIFLLTGNGPQKKELEELVKNKKIGGVHFLGNVPTEKLAYYINASDVCLALFDRNYGTIKKFGYFYSPIKVHDYKACGKPVIASNIGNLKMLVKDNINGNLVNESKKNEIITTIKKRFNNKKLNSELKKNNLIETNNNYNWINVTRNIMKVIK